MALEKLGLSVDLCQKRHGNAVDHMIREGHYLGRWPGTITAAFQLNAAGLPMGVLTYSLPPRETFKRYGAGLVWELSRLWVSDDMPRNTETWFIAKTIQWIQRNRHDVDLLISYADPSQGHQGTIYKAANWQCDGMTDDDRKSPRFDLVSPTGKKYGRASHAPAGEIVTRLPRVKKHRFIYRLKKSHASHAETTKGQINLIA